MVDRWLAELSPAARIVARFDSNLSMRAALQAGYAAAVLPTIAGQRLGLTRLDLDPIDFTMDLWTLTHPDLRRVPAVRAFVAHVTKAIRQRADAANAANAAR